MCWRNWPKNRPAAKNEMIWIRQLADTVSAAAQTGGYPDGIERLETLTKRLEEQKAAPDLIAYVKFRYLTAEYGQSMQGPDPDYAKIQDKWLADLEQFVTDYASTRDAAEAMLQLAIAEEFAATRKSRPSSGTRASRPISRKHSWQSKQPGPNGASNRWENPWRSPGKIPKGRRSTSRRFVARSCCVHYWSTEFGQCLPDLSVLKDMQAKYGKENVALIGVNVDNDRANLDAYLAENPLPWPQLYEPGGLDSPLANSMGILTLPDHDPDR